MDTARVNEKPTLNNHLSLRSRSLRSAICPQLQRTLLDLIPAQVPPTAAAAAAVEPKNRVPSLGKRYKYTNTYCSLVCPPNWAPNNAEG